VIGIHQPPGIVATAVPSIHSAMELEEKLLNPILTPSPDMA
jgi:hypothetical protein